MAASGYMELDNIVYCTLGHMAHTTYICCEYMYNQYITVYMYLYCYTIFQEVVQTRQQGPAASSSSLTPMWFSGTRP